MLGARLGSVSKREYQEVLPLPYQPQSSRGEHQATQQLQERR
jgi:hypothetical protein